jgi:endonuclease III
MANASKQRLVQVLLDRYGRTYCDELGIDIESGTGSALFCWLVASLLFSARIRASAAAEAARALFDHGWVTPQAMEAAGWKARVKVLNRSGYARYDESTSRMLGDTCRMLIERYGGDLWLLREAADRDPAAERRLLTEFKGIGVVGADLFLREAQTVWPENYPFADRRALKAAARLGLAETAAVLSKRVGRQDFPRLLAALVRVDLQKAYEKVKAQAL